MKSLSLYFFVIFSLLFGMAACDSGDGGIGQDEDSDDDDDNDNDDNDDNDNNDDEDDDDNDNTGDDDDDDDTDTQSEGPMIPECDCAAVGTSLDNMACAVDLCYGDDVILDQTYVSPTIAAATLGSTYEAIEHFGDTGNDLAPLLNESYAIMATGTANTDSHMSNLAASQSTSDPITGQNEAYDTVEWMLHLKAPEGAGGFQIHYVFFSTEYDEYVGSDFNDKFYIILYADSTNNGQPTVINFTGCRNPSQYFDETCTAEYEELGLCAEGDPLCYIAINTALSECCWYDGCPEGTWTTDVSGTGFTCGTEAAETATCDDPTGTYSGGVMCGYSTGSSTGWLKTEWPIDEGEDFIIKFHLHDTADAILDSEVIIDKFLFVGVPEPGTGPVM